MKRPVPVIDHGLRPWLLAAAAMSILPHSQYQPTWMNGLLLLLLGWSAWLWRYRGTQPPRWQLFLLVVIACAATLHEHRTLFGRDAGVSLLIVFMALKLLETRTPRDVHVVFALGCFLLLTHYFFAQDIPTALWLLASLLTLITMLIRLNAGSTPSSNPGRQSVRHAATLIAQALPFMLILFILFPRVNGPLWGLPGDAHKGQSGLSDQMSPGSISELVQSSEIAFRVRFESAPPSKQQLYWRGPVLERYDGTLWRQPRSRPGTERIEPQGPVLRYETTLEAHQQRWLLALDAPLTPTTSDFTLNGMLTAERKDPVQQRTRIRLSSTLAYRFNVHESQDVQQRNLQLPAGRNPKAVALAKQWREHDIRPDRIINQALTLFSRSEFAYTLRPPLLGEHPVDDFLFSTRRGFCEHYAAAFVVLMRAGGIPARVVTGYQGGEINPVDDYLIVRQSDAHAWSEVWLEDQGWIRIDPTAVVAPSRVDAGLANALPAGEPVPALLQVRADWLKLMRYRWDALNNAWNQYVLGYNDIRQRDFLSRLGILSFDWQSIAIFLGIGCAAAFMLITLWTLSRREPEDPGVRLWKKACAKLARKQLHCAPAETPIMLLERVAREQPALASRLADVVDAYGRLRYGNEPDQLDRLRRAVAALP